MQWKRHLALLPLVAGSLSLPWVSDCGAAKDLQQVSSGCDELNQGPEATANLQIDANVKAFVQASAQLKVIASKIKGDVKAACVDVCNRLGVQDTWSEHGDDDTSISNDEGTGACDKAAIEINNIMSANKATANFALMVTGPECTVDVDTQAKCEAGCQADASCTPGQIDVVTRCDPASLSVQCSGECQANAVCEGTASVAAQCEGTCEAKCHGHCSGTCIAELGTTTVDDLNCAGKCKGTCKGSCEGECKLTAQEGVECGATARCRGGCTGTMTAPACETELKAMPPECHVDANCEASCSAQAQTNLHCTEPKVTLATSAMSTPRIPELKAAIEANFPKLILAAKTQGPILVNAATTAATTGSAVVQNANSLGGKSLACAAAAAQVSASASVSVSASVKGSGKVESSCSGNES